MSNLEAGASKSHAQTGVWEREETDKGGAIAPPLSVSLLMLQPNTQHLTPKDS